MKIFSKYRLFLLCLGACVLALVLGLLAGRGAEAPPVLLTAFPQTLGPLENR